MAGLFGSSSKNQVKYTGIPIQTSAQAVCIPIVWGTTRVGVNLIWYGNFHTQSAKGSGKGGSSKSGSKDYYAAIVCGLCEGVVVDVITCFSNSDVISFAASGFGLFSGTQTQAPWSYLESAFPSQALSYAGTAYVAQTNYDLGSSPQLPSQNFEVQANLLGSTTTIADANPADVVYDFLTNKLYGLGLGSSLVGDLTQYRDYTWAANLLFSPCLAQQEQVTQTLQRWGQITNTWIFWSGNQLKFVPLGDTALSGNGYTYTPNLAVLYSLTWDDFLSEGGQETPPVTVQRVDPADGYNWVQLDCLDRGNQYNQTSVLWQDQASIDQYGVLSSNTVTATEFCDVGRAAIAAALIGKRSVYVRNTYSFKLGYGFILLEPGDIVQVTDPGIGLVAQPVRIVSIQENDKGELEVTAEEFPQDVGTAVVSSVPAYGGSTTYSTQVVPPSVNTPGFFEPQTSQTAGQPQVWVALSGGSNWGGCDVYISFDGDSYTNIGAVQASSLQGSTTTALPTSSDPDTTHTLGIDLTESLGVLPSTSTSADADAGRTLFLVDSEVMAYGTVVPTGVYTSNLTYLRRGQYGTTIASHSSGAEWSRLDPSVMFVYDLPKQYVGATLYFKFTSFNPFGNQTQDIADVTEYTYVPSGNAYPAPGVPTGVAATPGPSSATISWTPASSGGTATSFGVYRAAGSGAFGTATLVGSTAASPYYDASCAASTAYTWYVVATNGNGSSANSSGASATTGAGGASLAVELAGTIESVGTLNFGSGISGTVSGTTLSLSVPQQLTISAAGTVDSVSTIDFSYGLLGVVSGTKLSLQAPQQLTLESAGTVESGVQVLNFAGGTTLSASGTIATLTIGSSSPTYEVAGTVESASVLNFGSNLSGVLASGTLTVTAPAATVYELAGTVESVGTVNFSTGLAGSVSSGTLTVTAPTQLTLESAGTVVTASTLNISTGLTAAVAAGVLTLTAGGGAGTLELFQGGSYTPFGTLVATNGVTAAVSSGTATLQGLSYANQGTLIGGTTVAGSTWNPSYVGGSSTLSGGNLTFNGSNTGSYNWTMCIAQPTNTTGVTKFYWEITTGSQTGSSTMIGLATYGEALGAWMGASDSNGIGFEGQGSVWYAGNGSYETGITYGASTTIGIAWDVNAGKVWFNIGGSWVSGNPATGTGGSTMPVAGAPHPAVAVLGSGSSATANFGSSTFAHSVPTGFTAYGAASFSAVNLSEVNFSTNLSAVLSGSTLTVTAPQQLTLESSGTVITPGTLNFGGGTTISTSGSIATLSVGGGGGSSLVIEANGTVQTTGTLNFAGGTTLSTASGLTTITAGSSGGGGSTTTTISRPALSAFAWLNQGSATATDNTNGPLTIQSPTTTGDNLRYLVQSTPVANTSAWTVTVQLRGLRPLTDYVPIGLCLYDSSSGKLITLSSQITNGGSGSTPQCNVNVNEWNSTTSFNGTTQSYNMMLTEPFWMRIYCDGTNFNFQVSADGYDWITIKQLGVAAWGSPDHVGFGMDFIDTSTVGLQPEVKLLNWDLRTGTGAAYTPTTYLALANSQLVNIAAGVPALSTFTAVNQGSNTTTEFSGKAIYFKTPGGSSTAQLSGYSIAAPGTPYRVAVLLQGPIVSGSTQIGCGWTDGTKFHWISFQTEVYVQRWSSYTAYSSGDHSANIVPSNVSATMWFGLRDDGTNVYFEVSWDGVNFVTVYSVAKASGYLSNYNTLWWGANTNASSEATPVGVTLRCWDTSGLTRTF